MKPTSAAAFLAFVPSCRSVATQSERDLEVLARWMAGSFSSSAQAAVDPDYFDIRLYMAPIWTSRTDGHWLYVEQARADKLDAPYRQRVYRLHAEPGGFVSDVYVLPGDPLAWCGAWAAPALFDRLDPTQLTLREGCSIQLVRAADGSFHGSTLGDLCPSDRPGAKYATSEVTITETLLTSWDRGFDAGGKQSWGAVKGAYQFAKEL